jgi:hypothetical protein
VEALVLDGDDLYVAGSFTSLDNIPVGNVLHWDGTSWSMMAFGMQTTVRDLAFYDGDLYAAGDFVATDGGVTVNHVSRWDGTAWQPVGTGTSGSVHRLTALSNRLFLGGSFAQAGGAPASNVAVYDGVSYAPLALGVNNDVDAIAIGSGKVFFGGLFTTAGGNPSPYFGVWSMTPTAVTQSVPRLTHLAGAYPNPFNPSTRIRYQVSESGHVSLAIYDVRGARIRVLVDESQNATSATHSVTWDGKTDTGSPASSGVYFVRLVTASAADVLKIVMIK